MNKNNQSDYARSDLQVTPAALAAAARGDLTNALITMTPGGIEAQEKRGQLEQAAKATLPKKGTSKPEERALFRRLGFTFGDTGDDLFVEVQFPSGWRKRPTVHAMWSDLVDNQGRVRGGIFYKAAFYDQRAHINLLTRYRVDSYVEVDVPDRRCQVQVTDLAKVVGVDIKSGAVFIAGTYAANAKDWKEQDQLTAKAKAWLKEHYPDWANPEAYWD